MMNKNGVSTARKGCSVMLKKFSFENSYCFKDSVSLDLSAEIVDESGELKETEHEKLVRPGGSRGILPVAAIYGANASGKTKLIRSLYNCALDALGESFATTSVISGLSPFAQIVDKSQFSFAEKLKDVIKYDVCVVLRDAEYRFTYTIGKRGIVHEELTRREFGLNGVHETLYVREEGNIYTEGVDKNINGYLELMKDSDEERLWFPLIAPSQKSGLRNFYEWFQYVRDGTVLGAIELNDETFAEIAKRIANMRDEPFRLSLLILLQELDPSITLIRGIQIGDNQGDSYKLYVFHRECDAPDTYAAKELSEESDGTRKLIAVYPIVYHALEAGTPFICDELDSRLHPVAFKRFVSLFNRKTDEEGANNAQMIFTAHDTIALDSDYLRKDEVHIIQKSEDSISTIQRLDSIEKVRKYPNMEMDFRCGYYGSTPNNFLINGFPRGEKNNG